MRHRAGIVLYCKETKEVLLIRRIRDGKEYYIVAGGGVTRCNIKIRVYKKRSLDCREIFVFTVVIECFAKFLW